ncbi:YbaY family lipoprotein [Deinococcus aluminii]|uniref:Lipoprotein n=1 Tax=Deinococcus aluminii TaxID=1656885 RepID=A0ABP9XIC4_9DEIO
MKRFAALLLAALLATPASAQSITITRTTTSTSTNTSAPMPSLTDVPAGWRVVSGRISAPNEVRLPSGSTVTLNIEDVTRLNAPSTTRLTVSFPSTRLSTPYQFQYNPARMNPRRVYAVTVRVTGPNGRLLYSSNKAQELPRSQNAVLNLKVTPAR